MFSWLVALIRWLFAPWRAAPITPALAVVLRLSAVGDISYPSAPTTRTEDAGWREDASGSDRAGLPEDPDGRDYAKVVGCAGCSGLAVCEGCGVDANCAD